MKKFYALIACLLILACNVYAKPKAKYAFMLFEPETAWTVEDSIMRIEVNFSTTFEFIDTKSSKFGMYYDAVIPFATLKLFNTTEDVVFVDLSQCFISRNDKSQTLWDNTQTITTTGSNSGGSVSIQGITIGGSSGSSTTTVNQAEKIISIAPLSAEDITVTLVPDDLAFPNIYLSMFDSGTKCGPRLLIDNDIYRGQTIKYQKSESPINIRFFVKYSDKQDFSDTRKQQLSFYASELIGTKRACWDGESLKKELSEYGRQDIDPSLHCINLKLK